MQPVIPGRQNNPLVSPALDGGHVSVSPGSTEQEEEEGDYFKPTKAVQRFKNSLTSQVFLETKSPFLRSVHILFAFEVCLKELASCFEGHVRIVDRIPDAFEHNKGVCLLESTAALNVELYSVTVPQSQVTRLGVCCGSAFVPIHHPLVHPLPFLLTSAHSLMTPRAQDHYLCLPCGLALSSRSVSHPSVDRCIGCSFWQGFRVFSRLHFLVSI